MRDGVILIKLAPRGTSRIEPEMTLAHELNHVALRRIARDAYFPHWFYEGLAMTTTDDWNINRAEVLARASMAGKLFDLDGIDDAFGKIGATVELAYAESAHFVSWLAKENGDTPQSLVKKGRDLEKIVLARAVTQHIERRILTYDNKTVILN